jgi:hypothetical protein
VQNFIHSRRGRISHAGHDVGVRIEGYGYGGVSKKLLDELGVDAL